MGHSDVSCAKTWAPAVRGARDSVTALGGGLVKQAFAVMMALGLVGAVGCDSGETKKAEPVKTDGKQPEAKDVAAPDVKPEPAKPEPPPPDTPPPT